MAPITITLNGNSVIQRRAERAVMTVIVSAEDSSQETVSTHVRETSTALKTLLRELSPRNGPSGGATPDASITHWSNSSISTSSFELRDDKRNSLGRRHTARTSFEIKFRDFEKLGSVATQLSTMPHVQISGIQWRLTEATQKSLASKSRRDSVADAVQKAKDYLGAVRPEGKAEVVEISEGHHSISNNRHAQAQGMQFMSMGAQPRRMMMSRSTAQPEQEDDGLEFEPEDVEINSSVSVKFVAA